MPTRRSTLCALATIAFVSLMPRSPAAAGDAVVAASRHVEQVSGEAVALIGRPDLAPLDRKAALYGLLRRSLDIPLIARVVLGKSWRQASPEQQSRFVELFGAYLLNSVAEGLESYYDGETLTVTGATAKGKDVMVATRIDRRNGTTIKAAWRVRVKGGEPRIIDVVVEGISLALTKRHEFAAVIQSRGLDGLLTVLQVRTQQALAEAG